MRFLAGITVGVALAVALPRTRWFRDFTWWLFTADVRRTDPHLYHGWGAR